MNSYINKILINLCAFEDGIDKEYFCRIYSGIHGLDNDELKRTIDKLNADGQLAENNGKVIVNTRVYAEVGTMKNYSFEEAVEMIKENPKGSRVSLPEGYDKDWSACPGNHGVYGRRFRKYVENEDRGIKFSGFGYVPGKKGKVAKYLVV